MVRRTTLLTLLLGLAILTASITVAPTARADTIAVPANYTSIQAAIDVAQPGDRVLVDSGVYFESLVISLNITVESASGAEFTILDAAGADNAVILNNDVSRAAVFRGFTVRNGAGNGDAGGIQVVFASPTVSDNIILNNGDAGLGARGAGTPLFENNLIQGNEVGIDHWASDATIRNNVVTGNLTHGITLYNSPPVEISGNIIASNGLNGIDATIPINSTPFAITNNTIYGNEHGIELSYFADVVTISQNIIARNANKGVFCDSNDCPSLGCNNVWGGVS